MCRSGSAPSGSVADSCCSACRYIVPSRSRSSRQRISWTLLTMLRFLVNSGAAPGTTECGGEGVAQRSGVFGYDVSGCPVTPALQKQRTVPHLRHQQRGRYRDPWPDTVIRPAGYARCIVAGTRPIRVPARVACHVGKPVSALVVLDGAQGRPWCFHGIRFRVALARAGACRLGYMPGRFVERPRAPQRLIRQLAALRWQCICRSRRRRPLADEAGGRCPGSCPAAQARRRC